jgi:hypothetical protein
MHSRLGPPWPRERGVSAVKGLIIFVLLGVVGYAALYVYGSLRVAQVETTLSQRLADAGRPTPSEPVIDEALVRRRLIAMAQEEGVEVAPEDVGVVIEPLNASNFEKLPLQARVAIGAVSKMKNWEADAAFLSVRMTIRPKWGPVKRESVVERSSWVPKSALK